MDLVLALLPISIIWKLQMDWRKKGGLCSILGLGVLYAIAFRGHLNVDETKD